MQAQVSCWLLGQWGGGRRRVEGAAGGEDFFAGCRTAGDGELAVTEVSVCM